MQKKLLVIALAAIGAVGNAQAAAVANSVDEVTNFRFLDSTGAVLNANAFSALGIADSTNLNPSLNGAFNPFTNSVVAGPLPLEVRTVGAGPAVTGNFGHYVPGSPVPGAGADIARAASSLDGDPLIGLTPPQFIGANARTSALAQLANPGVANSASNIGLLATVTFVLPVSRTITIDFLADMHLATFLNSNLAANAASTLTFDLVNQTAGGINVFHFAPDGNLTAGETFDTCNLQRSIGTFGPGQAVANCSGRFGATSGLLLANTQYTFSIGQLNRADVLVSAVPEPSSLMLAGLALAGVGFVGARRKQTMGG